MKEYLIGVLGEDDGINGSSVTLDPIGGQCEFERAVECAGMTALWNDATCRVGGKAATCLRTPKKRLKWLKSLQKRGF